MKATVLKDSLKHALSVVERATAKTSTLPILSTVSLVATKNSVEVSGTDLEIGIRYQVLAKTETEGGVAVPARVLSQFVSVLPESQVQLVAKEGGLRITSSSHNTLLKTLPIEDFPIIPSLEGKEKTVELETKSLCKGLSQVVGMTGQAQARPEISGVYFLFEPEALRLAATDSYRLAEKTLLFQKQQPSQASFILPQKAARELVATFAELPGKTKLSISPTQVLFDYAGEQLKLQLVSRLIEGEYPQYQDVIPKSSPTKVVVDRQELLSNLRAASLFSGKLNDVRFEVNPKKKGVEISARSQQAGEHSSLLSAAIKGPAQEGSFNWRFFLDGVSQIQAKDVEIGFGGEDAPALMRSTEEEGYLYVLMPLRS